MTKDSLVISPFFKVGILNHLAKAISDNFSLFELQEVFSKENQITNERVNDYIKKYTDENGYFRSQEEGMEFRDSIEVKNPTIDLTEQDKFLLVYNAFGHIQDFDILERLILIFLSENLHLDENGKYNGSEFFNKVKTILSKNDMELVKDENNTYGISYLPSDDTPIIYGADERQIKKFPIKSWYELDIKISDTRTLIINYPSLYENDKVEISEIGMIDTRSLEPKKEFEDLQQFGYYSHPFRDTNGFITFNKKNDHQRIKRLADKLKLIFELDEDPFENNKQSAYKPKFKIQTNF